jgi:hypothetical protein
VPTQNDNKKIELIYDTTLFQKIKSGKTKEEWLEERKSNEVKIFTKPPKEGQYLFDLKKNAIGYFPNPEKSKAQAKAFKIYVENGLSVPLVEDSEFTRGGEA